ncbi:hypothetical protein JCM6882_009743 [Rhodosporidiobolus microsporus]
MSTRASNSSSSAAGSKPRKERQTRLQEHLRTVKSSRGISPAAMAKPQQQQQQQTLETVTTGRPKRKAAAKVVMQEVESDSDRDEDEQEDDDEEGSDAAAEEEDEEQEPEEQPQPARRGGRRSIPTPKRVASMDDLAPAIPKAAAASTSRKSPAKQTPSKKSPSKQPSSAQSQSKSAGNSNPRQREISNVSIDVDAMNDAEVQLRLTKEKDELMARLAQHGIIPQADVLDRALRSMSDSNEKLTVESFLRTLSSLNTTNGALPLPLPPAPLALQVSPPPASATVHHKRVTFSTLESPSTPSTAEHPIFNLPSPPQQQQRQPHFNGAPVSLLPVPPASASLLPSPPGFAGGADSIFAAQQQQQQHHQPPYANPAQLRATRLAAFAGNRSHSAPSLPTLAAGGAAPLPVPSPTSLAAAAAASPAMAPAAAGVAPGLFATQVDGMGRVALSRRNPFGGPQQQQQQQAVPHSHGQHPHHLSRSLQQLPHPHPHPHQPAHHRPGFAPVPRPHHAAPSLLPAFGANGGGNSSSLSGMPKRPRASAPQASANVGNADADRLRKLQSWLDDDDDTTEDEDAGSRAKGQVKDAAAELSLKAKAKSGGLAQAAAGEETRRVLEPGMKLVDAPGSDEEEEGMEVRVGGKSVTILRKSHKRQLEEDEAATASLGASHAAPVVTPVKQHSAAKAPVTRSTRSKGKQKAASECLCGEKVVVEEEDGEEQSTKRCSECDVVFHVGCLEVASPRLLPKSWACERCSGVDAASQQLGVDRPSTPPSVPLSAKRVRIGTTSTPIFPGQEPTFVMSSTFSPAPRRNNDFSDCADMALAPSPTASPVRQFATVAPTSPVPSKVSIPVTPQFGEATLVRSGSASGGIHPGDYSPHSPLTHRQRRARVASNGGGAFSEFLTGGWDGPSAFDAAMASSSHHHGAAASSDDYHLHSLGHALPSWSDVTMTPSRALASSSSSGVGMTPGTAGTTASSSSALWDSPFASSAGHHRRPSFTLSGGHLRTPSNLAGDIFSLGGNTSHIPHSAPPHSSSRLFAHSDSHASPQDPFAAASSGHGLSASPSLRPTSPLNPRRAPPGSNPNHHRRTSSTLGGSASALQSGARLAGPWSPTPSYAMHPPTHSHAHAHSASHAPQQPFSWLHERRPSASGSGSMSAFGGGGVGMKVSQSMPGLRSMGSHHGAHGMGGSVGIGFDGSLLDDISF